MTDSIKRVVASVERLHGSERDQATKYTSFLQWQLRERAKASGIDPSPVLKQTENERG
jgi:hypothetical protein